MVDEHSPHDGAAAVAPPGSVPAYYARRKKRHNEICQILLRNGAVKPEAVRRALKVQEERGGQIGRILVSRGDCTERALAEALRMQVELLHAAGSPRHLAMAARRSPALAGLTVRCSPVLTSITLFLLDALTCVVIAGVVTGVDVLIVHQISPSLAHYGYPYLALCLLLLSALGAHRPIASSPPDEIRTSTVAASLVLMAVAVFAMFRWDTLLPERMGLILASEWALACLLLPTVRALARARLAKTSWWGVPVVVLGAGKTGRTLVRALQSRPERGLRPVFVLDDDPKKHGSLVARLDEGADIQVDTRRGDLPAPSMSSPTLPLSSRHMPVARPARSDLPRLGDTTMRSARASDIFPTEPAPQTIRSPSPTPPAGPTITNGAPPPAAGSSPPVNGSTFQSAPRLPDVGPSTPKLVVPPPSLSSRRLLDPSWLHQVPESVQGMVRGQFAEIEGVPIVGGIDVAPLLASRLGISYGIVAMPGQSSRKVLQVTERIGGAFPHLLVIPDMIGFASLGVPSREIDGVVGLEVRQQLLLRGPRLAKRSMDIALTLLGGLFVLPVVALLWILVRLDSKGPAFYSQKRLGRDGKQFTAYKFRSMHGDGEARLKAVLETDPKARAEYDEFHKLSKDPRITRVGHLIRKYSLDELPQLWNVLNGDMSLVGPRPYLQRELPEMENHEHIILRAVPGLTGLWQVGDRNATGFAERVRTDVHYVKNWSPWLDLYVLARTIGVVINGTGS